MRWIIERGLFYVLSTGSIAMMVLGIIVLIIIVGLIISCVKIVPQAQAMVIERWVLTRQHGV